MPKHIILQYDLENVHSHMLIYMLNNICLSLIIPAGHYRVYNNLYNHTVHSCLQAQTHLGLVLSLVPKLHQGDKIPDFSFICHTNNAVTDMNGVYENMLMFFIIFDKILMLKHCLPKFLVINGNEC